MDITPLNYLLKERLEGQKLGHVLAQAELIDNAIDAGASSISLTYADGNLVVEDDGDGVKDLSVMFRLGDSRHTRKGALGRYGVGFLDAVLWYGTSVTVETAYQGLAWQAGLDATKLLKAPAWVIDDPVPISRDKGTKIIIKTMGKRGRPQPVLDDQLSLIFWPTLREGIQIKIVRGSKVSLLRTPTEPPTTDSLAGEFALCGKVVAYRVGILAKNHRAPHQRLRIEFGHRVIKPDTSMFFGDYSGDRVTGVVTLGDGWKLSRNKDDITELQSELASEVYDRIEELLKTASEQCEDMKTERLSGELEQMLDEDLNRREKRTKGDKHGSVKSKGTDKRRTKATQTSEKTGSVRMSRQAGKINIAFASDCDKMVTVELVARRVTLNKNHPLIAKAIKNDDINTLHLIVVHHFCHAAATQDMPPLWKDVKYNGDFDGPVDVLCAELAERMKNGK